MKKIIAGFTVCLLLAGCADFLKEDNKGGISNDDLYSTAVGYETLMAASYSSLRTVYRECPWVLLGGTDLYQKAPSSTGDNLGMYEYTGLYPSNTRVRDFYKNCYAAIQTINAALYYNDIPKDMDNNVRATYKSELRFLRAYYHFVLVEQFGGIPINKEITLSPRLNIPRNTLSECYEFIISEIEDCIGGLGQSTVARVNQDVANHYLAKIYLTRGWDMKNADDFAKTKSYAQKVFDSRGEIVLTYESLWSWKNENNSEVIFAVQYDAGSIPSGTSGQSQQSLYCPQMDGSATQSKTVQRELAVGWAVHKWYPENDTRYENTFMLTCYYPYFDYYFADDPSTLPVMSYYPRLWGRPWTQADTDAWLTTHTPISGKVGTFRIRPFIENDEKTYRSYINEPWWTPPVKKFDSPASRTFTMQSSTASVRDIVLARLGETYYLYAEACIGLNDFATAAAYVRKVIDRPGNALSGTLPNALDGATTREEALHGYLIESGKEFMGEYNGRWPELRRTGMLKFMLERYNYDIQNLAGVTLDFSNKYNLRPIPEEAMDLNDGITEKDQNPGY